jgi:hypothetical protein
VCIEEDQVVICEEPVDTKMLENYDTSTHDEITTFPTYDDYEYVGVLAPTYDEEASPFHVYDSYDEEGIMLPTYDEGWLFEIFPWDMDHSSHDPCM